jgi:hypothetical protein
MVRAMQRGEVQYAKAGEHHIAYREYVGDAGGDHEIVMVSGANFPMDSLPDDPVAHRLLEGLASHGRLKARLRPMRGLRTDRTARVVIAGHAFMQNVRRGHYELGVDADPRLRVRDAFNELTETI